MTVDIAQMKRETLDLCLDAKERFPNVPDKTIGLACKFAVMAAHALVAARESLPPGYELSPAGVEMVFDECAKHVFGRGT